MTGAVLSVPTFRETLGDYIDGQYIVSAAWQVGSSVFKWTCTLLTLDFYPTGRIQCGWYGGVDPRFRFLSIPRWQIRVRPVDVFPLSHFPIVRPDERFSNLVDADVYSSHVSSPSAPSSSNSSYCQGNKSCGSLENSSMVSLVVYSLPRPHRMPSRSRHYNCVAWLQDLSIYISSSDNCEFDMIFRHPCFLAETVWISSGLLVIPNQLIRIGHQGNWDW